MFTAAARTEARGMKLLYRANGGSRTRFAVVVARGCGAVKRNREKRLTREAWRTLKERVPPGYDVLFLVARFGQPLSERKAAMAQILARARWRGRTGPAAQDGGPADEPDGLMQQ